LVFMDIGFVIQLPEGTRVKLSPLYL
jgi:hypothetical protein